MRITKFVNWYYETSSTLWTASIFNTKKTRFYKNPQKGQPCQMEHSDGRIIVYPYHDEADRYTLKGALRDAEIEEKESIEDIK